MLKDWVRCRVKINIIFKIKVRVRDRVQFKVKVTIMVLPNFPLLCRTYCRCLGGLSSEVKLPLLADCLSVLTQFVLFRFCQGGLLNSSDREAGRNKDEEESRLPLYASRSRERKTSYIQCTLHSTFCQHYSYSPHRNIYIN